MNKWLTLLGVSLLGMSSHLSYANDYALPIDGERIIGENVSYIVPDDKRSLETIAAEYQVGLLNMMEANPDIDPLLPEAGKTLEIPLQMILPETVHQGIVINLAELRLYYYPKEGGMVSVYPIGIGQLGRETPEMVTSISQLIKDPTWTPTTNIRKNYAAKGITLPAVVPAGPDNPMGAYALRLAHSRGEYLIHGTNADFGIGLRVSSGCIRLRPNDIETLFNIVPKGTRVQVINRPIKFTEVAGRQFIEVHQPLSRNENDDPQTMPLTFTKQFNQWYESGRVDKNKVDAEITRRSGIPVDVTAD
ncbi:L,D-transpeptidase family protein [Proteus myxofaciens]|uniref:L,D-transpeptidase n=1 Tax=Proteus myxofaciens ATCC 19692 TaxID=1354337 RepID=A0A198FB50_9GAMM|nr:L,D-transpeptidase family protein [Proteus myxofaciens]OAT21501.1 L,D-transpeptidase [Proteus myxofaciens ATCC 19692]